MNFYFKIKKINKKEGDFILSTFGEFQSYDNNIRQKSSNDVNLKFTFNQNEIIFSNFGYSSDGNIFCYIYLNKYLILYDISLLKTIEVFDLPDEIKNNILEFVYEEKRNLFKQIFSRLSFLELNKNTNNIFLDNKGTFVILSTCNIH